MWEQRNKDRHQPGNKTNYLATIKVDRDICGLYSMRNQVHVDDVDEFFTKDIDELLQQTVPSKKRWGNRFRAVITSSVQRAKCNATCGTILIYKCLGNSRPSYTFKRYRLRKQKLDSEAAEAKLRQRAVTTNSNISITGRARSNSIAPAKGNATRLHQRRIDTHFAPTAPKSNSKRKSQRTHEEAKIEDRFGDKSG